jgi:glycosyltransferase involved in cell wall biosynthesis
MKRVLIDGTTISKKIDGLSQYILNVVKYIDTSDIDYTLIVRPNQCPEEYVEIFRSKGINIEEVMIPAIGPLREYKFRKYLREHQVYDAAFVPSNQFPVSLTIPSLYTIHDIIYEQYPEQLGKMGWLKSKFLHWNVSVGMKLSKKVIAVSNYTRQELLRIHGERYKEKIAVVYEGWEHLQQRHLNMPKCPIFERYLLYVGSSRGHKNLNGLMAAIHLCQDQIPCNMGLIIVGNNSMLSSHQLEQMETLNKQRKLIHLTGWISNDELSGFFQHAEGLIFPSLCEGFGIPVLEAYYYKLPLLLSNCSSLPEVAGDAAIYFTPHSPSDIADKIVSFINMDTEQKDQLIALESKRLLNFSWKNTAKEIDRMILELVN